MITVRPTLPGEIPLAATLVGTAVDHETGGVDVEVHAVVLLPQSEALQEQFGNQFPLLMLRRPR